MPRSGVTGTARPTFHLLYRELVPGRRAGSFGTGTSPNFRTLELPNFRTSPTLHHSIAAVALGALGVLAVQYLRAASRDGVALPVLARFGGNYIGTRPPSPPIEAC